MLSGPILTARVWLAALFCFVRGLVLKWLPSSLAAPHAGDEWLNVSWLSKHLGKRVKSAETAPLPANRGFIGSIRRVKVAFEDGSQTSIILKASYPTNQARRTCISLYIRECWFYCDPRLRKAADRIMPTVFYAHQSTLFGDYMMLMEDLSADESCLSTGANMLYGNQIWGVPDEAAAVVKQIGLDIDATVDLVFREAALFHSRFWRDPSILGHTWLKGSQWYRGNEQDKWERNMKHVAGMWDVCKARAATGARDFTMSPKLSSLIDRSFEQASWDGLQRVLQSNTVPWTLCHGDFHASNMIITRKKADDPSKARLHAFDWSEVGPWEPTADLAQTLISDVPHRVYSEPGRTKRWVRSYWEHLTGPKGGVSASEYSFEQCYEAFCHTGVERWIWMFALLGTMNAVPGNAMQYFHDQLLAFIESHGDKATYPLTTIAYLI